MFLQRLEMAGKLLRNEDREKLQAELASLCRNDPRILRCAAGISIRHDTTGRNISNERKWCRISCEVFVPTIRLILFRKLLRKDSAKASFPIIYFKHITFIIYITYVAYTNLNHQIKLIHVHHILRVGARCLHPLQNLYNALFTSVLHR